VAAGLAAVLHPAGNGASGREVEPVVNSAGGWVSDRAGWGRGGR
jgi:hypothetical protein